MNSKFRLAYETEKFVYFGTGKPGPMASADNEAFQFGRQRDRLRAKICKRLRN
jgi:hypothetical protein